ncbi:hypothetical protein C6H88_02610 [Chlamydia muridarum str. Nigg]|uniref:Membrane protein n=2 Tax=Chlamydia muridarum TaxID=83560 RepID=A0A069ZXA2_CHLMR|nr:membrane protein [Chlamydia muridarum]UFW99760.1 hypothetical protein FTM85_02715 [Chlamydia trachomatis]AAF39346.1 hypothetical protein TC_0504 [Chlamydia muridarum str. Nigg]AHH22893.1 membrane protein [Chlamydia muridarum str. Nigg3 CMUT3-5]AHH23818.1 membrane protein [Chlamydia muridarum str. Nigg CM972]AID38027.1 membrane protein [Chlamydia muridarum str. Nigg 2 MCR]
MTYPVSDTSGRAVSSCPTSPSSPKKKGLVSPSAAGIQGGQGVTVWGPADPFFTVPVYPQQLASMQNNLFILQTEVSSLKKKLVQSNQPQGSSLGRGPQFLAACLVATTILAVAVIVLASLGLAGILPFVIVCLAGATNAVWAIVSASIVALICCTSIASIFLTKYDRTTSEKNLYIN